MKIDFNCLLFFSYIGAIKSSVSIKIFNRNVYWLLQYLLHGKEGSWTALNCHMLITVIFSGNLEIGESASDDWRIELLIIHYSIAMIMRCCVNALLNALLCNCGNLWELLIKMHNNNNELVTSYAMLIFFYFWKLKMKMWYLEIFQIQLISLIPHSLTVSRFSMSHDEMSCARDCALGILRSAWIKYIQMRCGKQSRSISVFVCVL